MMMTTMRTPMISLRSVTKTYEPERMRPIEALRHVDLDIRQGEFVVVTGRSAAGKTTLLNVIAGLTRPTTGTVTLNGADLWRLSDRQQSLLRNRAMGFVFQFPSLLPSLSVLQNVLLPLSLGRVADTEGKRRAIELLTTVGLSDRVTSYPRHLSAGQQQRVVIARALVNGPELLLADEPSSDLDEQTEAEIMALFSAIHRDTGITIVLVTHTRQLVAYGTRHLAMAGGVFTDTPCSSGAAQELLVGGP
jgi:ABC-type lipoprotein export system ATPase subunit